MKIEVSLGVSNNKDTCTFTLDELGFTKLEWDNMSDDEKKEAIQAQVFELSDQPYWMLDSFEET